MLNTASVRTENGGVEFHTHGNRKLRNSFHTYDNRKVCPSFNLFLKSTFSLTLGKTMALHWLFGSQLQAGTKVGNHRVHQQGWGAVIITCKLLADTNIEEKSTSTFSCSKDPWPVKILCKGQHLFL